MNFSSDDYKDIKPEISIVSLIDVVLLLLVFLMLTTNFVLQSGIEVKLPKAEPTVKKAPSELTVTITHKGNYYLNGKVIKLKGLKAALKKKTEKQPENILIIRSDERVQHGKVVHVMDLAKLAGIKQLAIATESAP